MSTTDPISDLLIRIKNANFAKHDIVDVPSSNMKVEIAKILKEQRFITDYNVIKDGKQGILQIMLRYNNKKEPAIEGIKRLSKPGKRWYAGVSDMQASRRKKKGVTILTTPKGIMVEQKANDLKVGGELLCEVW